MILNGWSRQTGIRHTLAAADQNFSHLQGDREPTGSVDILGHANIKNTVRYLGLDIDRALILSERTEI